MKDRLYQKQNKRYKEDLDTVISENKPLFILKIETTGLDIKKDRICGIIALRCEYEDGKFVLKEKYSALVKSDVPIIPEAEEVSGITNELVNDKGISEEEMIEALTDFLGEEAYVTGFNTKYFLSKFLNNTYERYGKKLVISHAFDMQTLARAVALPLVNEVNHGYGARILCNRCGTSYTADGFVEVLNVLYSLLPKGRTSVGEGFIKTTKRESVSNKDFYIVFITKGGKVALNVRTLYWEEFSAGFFDTYDMDSLTEYVIKATKSKNVYDMVQKYVKKVCK